MATKIWERKDGTDTRDLKAIPRMMPFLHHDMYWNAILDGLSTFLPTSPSSLQNAPDGSNVQRFIHQLLKIILKKNVNPAQGVQYASKQHRGLDQAIWHLVRFADPIALVSGNLWETLQGWASLEHTDWEGKLLNTCSIALLHIRLMWSTLDNMNLRETLLCYAWRKNYASIRPLNQFPPRREYE